MPHSLIAGTHHHKHVCPSLKCDQNNWIKANYVPCTVKVTKLGSLTIVQGID